MQWSRTWFTQKTPNEMMAQVNAALLADKKQLQYEIRKAIFTPTNRPSVDRLVDNMSIPVKAFANADGFPIPSAPGGFTFNASTHTHYMGTAGSTLVASDIDLLLLNVEEHNDNGDLYLYVSQDVAATMDTLKAANNLPSFAPLLPVSTVMPTNAVYAEGRLEHLKTFNRMTGIYKDARVFIKPWMPPATLFAFMTVGDKPLVMRRPKTGVSSQTRDNSDVGGISGDFVMIYEDQSIPIMGQNWGRSCGFAVNNRIAGAVMTVGSSTYTMPNITPGSTTYMS